MADGAEQRRQHQYTAQITAATLQHIRRSQPNYPLSNRLSVYFHHSHLAHRGALAIVAKTSLE